MYNPINEKKNKLINLVFVKNLTKEYILSDFLKSSDSDEIHIDQQLIKNFKKLSVLNAISEGYTLEQEGYTLKIAHCYRSLSTYYRLKKEGKSPSKTSQHFYGEAMDCHVYYMDARVRGKGEMKHVAKIISKKFPDMFLQIFYYSWGIHFSIETERSKKAGIKNKFGYGGR